MGTFEPSQKKSSLTASIPQTANLFRSRSFPKPSATVEEASTDTPDFQARWDFARSHAPNLNSLAANSSGDRAPSTIQPKLTVGAPNDQYEQEADRVADQVMSMPDSATQQPVQREANLEEDEVQTKAIADSITPLVQREAMPEEEELHAKAIDNTLQREEMPEEELQTKPALQRSTDGSLEAGSSIESRLNSSKGGGSPLSDEVRSFMEPRFGADFSQVRVHTGSESVQMNRDLNAQAFAHKQDVYFGNGKSPGKDVLTAHELTHVVQQSSGTQTKAAPDQPNIQLKCSACDKEAKVQRSIEVSQISSPSIQKFDPIEYIPGVGKLWKVGKCVWKYKKYSKVTDTCTKNFNDKCSDVSSDECIEFMEGSAGLSDAIPNCARKKAPGLFKDLLENCTKAVTSSY